MGGEGMSLSAEEKLRVVHRLDELGIDVIEAGFLGSNPKEVELFERLAAERLEHADIAAFGMTRRRDSAADSDPALRVLAESFVSVCTLVGKSWGLHLEKVVKVDREENLRMIADSIGFLVANGKRVVYDAEHFFDGWRDDRDYALRCLRAATDAGAETVVPCDTNGGSLPPLIAEAMRDVAGALDGAGVRIGIHCHNDAECAVANSIAGVLEGATQVQGTINGYGERCGNANLVSIIANLQLKLGYQCLEDADGSFELLLRKERGEYEPLFRLESWRAIVEQRADGKVETEATIKIWVGGERYVRTAEGNGPVNALDKALRSAIGEIYPHLNDIELVNFKVRILDETHGTGAITRVLLDASDGQDVWGSIGVSENVIEASWDALVDSLEYGMQVGRREAKTTAAVPPA